MPRIVSVSSRKSIVFALLCALFASPALAEVITTGSVSPSHPMMWNEETSAWIGIYSNGTLEINADSDLISGSGCIGYWSGSTGVVTVGGIGSTWTNQFLYVGDRGGHGTLNILNGGQVNVQEDTWVARDEGSVGEIHFDGGTLTTAHLFARMDQLTGTGTINIHGFISDADLVFENATALTHTVIYDRFPGQNIAINLEVDGQDFLGVGYVGNASLFIRNGTAVSSTTGTLGDQSGSTGIATVEGIGSSWSNSEELYIGNEGSGTLNTTNGGAVHSRFGYLGYEVGSTGAATVEGISSSWTNSLELYVGHEGEGTLNITSGGAVNSGFSCLGYRVGSTGAATVDGAGSTWIARGVCVGQYGEGTLNITNGGFVKGKGVNIGYDYGSTGTVWVDGVGSTWISNDSEFIVGSFGNGTMRVTHGGVVNSNQSSHIAHNSGSVGAVTVDGKGSVWTNSSYLVVGSSGEGTLNIDHGALVESNFGGIGIDLASTGAVIVNVGSKWMIHQGLTIGHYGCATLDIVHGGEVSNKEGYIGMDSSSRGMVTVDGAGSTWNNYNLHVGYAAPATLHITNEGTVHSVLGNIGSESVVTVEGIGSAWVNDILLSVGGERRGTLNIADGGRVIAGYLVIDPKSDENSCINLAGGGMLAILGQAENSITDFLNLIAGTGSVYYWNNSIQGWAEIREATYGVDYTLEYITEGDLAGYTVLTVGVPEPVLIPGDYNADGSVDLADYTVWADHYGQSGANLPGDGNGDGTVDFSDYTVWADHYGETSN